LANMLKLLAAEFVDWKNMQQLRLKRFWKCSAAHEVNLWGLSWTFRRINGVVVLPLLTISGPVKHICSSIPTFSKCWVIQIKCWDGISAFSSEPSQIKTVCCRLCDLFHLLTQDCISKEIQLPNFRWCFSCFPTTKTTCVSSQLPSCRLWILRRVYRAWVARFSVSLVDYLTFLPACSICHG
jgi:hypothetical protein